MKSRIIGISTFIILAGIFIVGFYLNARCGAEEKPAVQQASLPKSEKVAEAEAPPVDGHMFESIFARIKQDYVEPVTDGKLLEGALLGMLGSLDPHSTYLNPKEFKELQEHTKGEFGGLGLEVVMEGGLVKIVSPIDDTPAAKAGIQPGDMIVGINKKPVYGMTLMEAVEMMRGKPGTKVRLHIRRTGQDVFEKDLIRAAIHPKVVKWRMEGNVGYIRISTFADEHTTKLVQEAVVALQTQMKNKLEGIVIDLRNNPGGLFDTGVGVANLFLTKGQEIVSIKGRNPKLDTHIQADKQDILKKLPLVVLVNGGSASSAEIMAGALRDNHRAIIVGTRSFGKGSVQAVLPMTNGGALKLTIARYYTPANISIQAKGIEPDIVIEQAMQKLEEINEEGRLCEGAIKGALDTKKDKKVPEEDICLDGDQKKKTEIEDYQLTRALDIVRTMYLTEKFAMKGKTCP